MLKESAYSVKNICTDAIISCVLGGLSLLFLLIAVLLSYRYNGAGPAIVGLLGVGSFILAFMGIVFCVYAWKSQDGGILMKRVAGIVNALPLLIAVGFYIYGWM